MFSYLTATHGEEVFGELECLCKPLMCKLSITSRLKIQKITFLLSFEGLSLSSHLTRIVGVAPPLRGGATVPSALRAELCKYAPFPFLLPSAGLNANSKYSHRAALRAMENSNKYCRNNSKLTTHGPGWVAGSLENGAVRHLGLITSLHIVVV